MLGAAPFRVTQHHAMTSKELQLTMAGGPSAAGSPLQAWWLSRWLQKTGRLTLMAAVAAAGQLQGLVCDALDTLAFEETPYTGSCTCKQSPFTLQHCRDHLEQYALSAGKFWAA